MKKLFVHARSGASVCLTGKQKRCLPRPVTIVSTIQHSHLLQPLAKQLTNASIGGVILGCDYRNALRKTGCYLFVGTGLFHPLMLGLKSGKPVYTLNPNDWMISRVDDCQLESLQRKRKASLVRFLHSRVIGILVSTKPGQEKLRKALSLQQRLKKKSYILLSDSVDVNALENFPFVDCFVNTACPRLVEDSPLPMVNSEDI
ncbi:MAG: diphthamide synthesis protein [Candidatus Woesearchaeota archaeon]